MSVHFYHRKGSPVTMTTPRSSLGISRGDSICLCVSLRQRGKCGEYNGGYCRTGLGEGLCESVPVATCPTYWVTVPRTRDLNIRRRRVPLAEIYYSISENFHIVYTNKTGESSVGATPACGGVATLPAPRSLEGWLGFERNGRGAVTPDARFGDNIRVPTQRSGS